MLTRFPTRESVLRSIATKDLSSHPMRMRILSESAAADESKDLSSHPTRESVLRSIASERSELVTSLCQSVKYGREASRDLAIEFCTGSRSQAGARVKLQQTQRVHIHQHGCLRNLIGVAIGHGPAQQLRQHGPLW